jgi:hypothetical protein
MNIARERYNGPINAELAIKGIVGKGEVCGEA